MTKQEVASLTGFWIILGGAIAAIFLVMAWAVQYGDEPGPDFTQQGVEYAEQWNPSPEECDAVSNRHGDVGKTAFLNGCLEGIGR